MASALTDFPGPIQETKKPSIEMILEALKSIDIRGHIGPPGCGKTTQRNVIKLAYVCIGNLFSDDMSDIMAWHRLPQNESPYAQQFIVAKGVQSAGNLVGDRLVSLGLGHRLRIEQKKVLDVIKKLDLSGAPRTREQYEDFLEMFGSVQLFGTMLSETDADKNRLARIAANVARDDDNPDTFKRRWANYHLYTEPFIEWAVDQNIMFLQNFSVPLKERVMNIGKKLHLNPAAFASFKKQLLNPDCQAYWEIKRIEDPEAYKAHMEKTQGKLAAVVHHIKPQITYGQPLHITVG